LDHGSPGAVRADRGGLVMIAMRVVTTGPVAIPGLKKA
jgi:hypothetical protein